MKAPEAAAGAAATIMIVEDEDMLRLVTLQLVEDMGFRAVPAASAEEALALIGAGTQAEVLLTDIRMPGMDGFALAERVCALRPGTGIVFTTGYADIQNQVSAGRIPRLLRKPYAPGELEAEIRSALAEG
jgi:CheY-like chemotaxis protein